MLSWRRGGRECTTTVSGVTTTPSTGPPPPATTTASPTLHTSRQFSHHSLNQNGLIWLKCFEDVTTYGLRAILTYIEQYCDDCRQTGPVLHYDWDPTLGHTVTRANIRQTAKYYGGLMALHTNPPLPAL